MGFWSSSPPPHTPPFVLQTRLVDVASCQPDITVCTVSASIQRCQVCAKLHLTVKVRWPIIIARSIDTHAFLPWRLLSIELVTVWRGFDSLRGFGGQGRAIDDGNTYFSIFLFPPNRSDKGVGTLHNRRPYTCFQEVWGGGGKGHWWQKYIFCFPIFFQTWVASLLDIKCLWTDAILKIPCTWKLRAFLLRVLMDLRVKIQNIS